MEDELIITNDQITNILSLDITTMYLKEIEEYPLLDKEEQIRLISEYQKGEIGLREKIINSNLRLVVSIANRYIKLTTYHSFLDLVQEGSIGLMRAIETYDKNQGSFSTYATFWIRRYIINNINKDKLIIIPNNTIQISKDYDKFLKEYYKKHHRLPDDEYIKQKLNISSDILSYLKKRDNYNITSIDKKIKSEDSESGEIVDYIVSSSNDYENLIDNMDAFDFLNVIKSILKSKEYYILYYRVLTDNIKTLAEISKTLGITGERIRQSEKAIVQKIKPYTTKNGHLYNDRLDYIKKIHGDMYYKLKLEPLTPNQIYIYLYLKDKLSETEQRLLYLKLIDQYNYTIDEIKQIMQISGDEFNIVYNNLTKIMNKELKDLTEFNLFKEKIIKEYGTKIYKIELIDKEKNTTYKYYDKKTLKKSKYS